MFTERKMVKALRWLINLYKPEDYSGYDEEEYGVDGGLSLPEICMALRDRVQTIYQYTVQSEFDVGFNYRGKSLFNMNGCRLFCKNKMAMYDSVMTLYNTELWLLEDMTFAIARCVHMTIECDYGDYETEYRSIEKRVCGVKDLICTPEDLFAELEEMCVPQWEGTATIYEI